MDAVTTTKGAVPMKKASILSVISGALVAGSLVLAGPASAHTGHVGDGPASPTATSAHTAADGQIGVGIFTSPAVGSRAAVGSGGEQPFGPIGGDQGPASP